MQARQERTNKEENLKSTTREKVSSREKTLIINPASTEVVYVSQYDPWLVYGYPLAMFPGWYPYPGLFLDGPGIAFGLGFGVGLFGGFGWGWHHWGYDWHHDGRVVYNHNTYISHSRTIVNRNSFRSGRTNFNHGADSRNRNFGGHQASHGPTNSHRAAGTHSRALSGVGDVGSASGHPYRRRSSYGGM